NTPLFGSVDALVLDPVARAGHGGDEGLAVDHALALERDRLGEHRRGIDRIDQADRAVQGARVAFHAHDLGDQLHQPAFAAVGIALEPGIAGQHAGADDGVVGTAYRVQLQAQLADALAAGAQQAEQRGALVGVVQAIGGKAQTHVRLHWGRSASLAAPARYRIAVRRGGAVWLRVAAPM